MPIINIPEIGQVRFPDEMSDEDIVKAIKNNILKTPQEEPSFAQRAKTAFKRGVEQIPESLSGIALGAESGLGFDKAAQKKLAEIKAQKAMPEEGAPSITFEELEKTYGRDGAIAALKKLPSYVTEQILQSAPSMAVPLAVGAAATPFTGPLGGLAAGIGTYGLQQYGQFMQRQAEGANTTAQLEPGKAAVAAAVTAPLGFFVDRLTLGMSKVPTKVLGESIFAELAKRAGASVAGRAVTGATVGVVAETPTEVLEQMAERWQANLPLFDDAAVKEYKEAAAGAAAIGGLGGATSRAMAGRPEKTVPSPQVQAPLMQAPAVQPAIPQETGFTAEQAQGLRQEADVAEQARQSGVAEADRAIQAQMAAVQEQQMQTAQELARAQPEFSGAPNANTDMMGAMRQRQEEARAAEEQQRVAEQTRQQQEHEAQIQQIQNTVYSADPVQNQIVQKRLLENIAKPEEVVTLPPAQGNPPEEIQSFYAPREALGKPRGASEQKFSLDEKQEIADRRSDLAAINKDLREVKKDKSNLFTFLGGKIIARPGGYTLADIDKDNGKLKQLYNKQGKGRVLEDIVADGTLDNFLPPEKRAIINGEQNPRFDGNDAMEFIASKLRSGDYTDENTSAAVAGLTGQKDQIKREIERLSAIPDVNLELSGILPSEYEPISTEDLEKDASNLGLDLDSIRENIYYSKPDATQEQYNNSYRNAIESAVRQRTAISETLQSQDVSGGNSPTKEGYAVQQELQGRDFNQVVQWHIDNAPNKFQKLLGEKTQAMIRALQARGVNMSFELASGGTRSSSLSGANGVTNFLWDFVKGTSIKVALNGEPVMNNQMGYPSGMDYGTVQHELLHVATRTATKFLPKDHPIIKELNDLYKTVGKQFNADAKAGTLPPILQKFYKRHNNVLSSVDEMISWGMTDRDFQDYLSKINVGPKQNAFSKLVSLIREVLGISKPFQTAMEKLVHTTDSLLSLDADVVGREMQNQGYSYGKPVKKVGPMAQQSLFRGSERIQRDDLAVLEKGPIRETLAQAAAPARTATGNDAMEIMAGVGRFVKEPEPGYIAKARESWDNARDNPQLTKEQALGSFRKFADQIETWAFSSDAALNNQIRREVMNSTVSQQVKIGMLLNTSLSQTAHSDAIANLFLMKGNIQWDNELHKWTGVDDVNNIITLSRQLDEIADKHGLSKEEIELIAHTAFEAKRTKSLIRENAEIEARADAIKAEAAAIRGKSPVGASELSDKASKLLQKKKVIHLNQEQIDAGMTQFKLFPELNAVVKTWDGIRENAINVMVDTGLYSPDEAANLLANADYVPFFREDQIEEGKGPKEFLRSLSVQADKRMKGSEKPVNDIFDNMVRWTQYAINRGVRNRSALALVDAAKEMNLGKQVKDAKDGENVVRVWRNGNEEYVSMADPLFMSAFRGLESVAIPTVKFFSKFADILRQSVVLYPLFSVAQVPQDAFAAMFTSGLKPQYALTIPMRAVKEFIQTLRGKSSIHEELKNVGAVGVRDFTSSIIRTEAEILSGLKKDPSLWNSVKRKLGNLAMAADNSVRQATYEAALAQGLSRAEAIEKAFEIFNVRRRGNSQMLAMAGQVIPFFNAYLSAQHVAYRTITGVGTSPTERKAAFETLAATTGSVMAMSMIYAMMMADDEGYEKKPTPTRDRLLIIPGTNGVSIPLRSDIFAMPKIFAEHMYHMITENGMTDAGKFRASMKSVLANSIFSPTPVPQAIKPLAEAIMNYDFFQQKPLIGIFQGQKEVSRQFEDSTSEFSKLIGKSEMISPIVADHLIRGMLGSFGGLFLYATNPMLAAMAGTTRPSISMQDALATIPNASGFVSKEYEVGLRKDFYALKEVTDRAAMTMSDLKNRSPQEIGDYLQDDKVRQRLALSPVVNRISGQLTKIRKQIGLLTNVESDSLGSADKEEKIKQLREAEYQLLKNVNLRKLREMAQV